MLCPSAKGSWSKVMESSSGPVSSRVGVAAIVETALFSPSEMLTVVTAKKYWTPFSRPATLAEFRFAVTAGDISETESKSVAETYTA